MVQLGSIIQNIGSPDIHLVLLGVPNRYQFPLIDTVLFVQCYYYYYRFLLTLLDCIQSFKNEGEGPHY